MKPFNLEEALAGAPLITRDGRKVLYFKKDPSSDVYPCIAEILGPGGYPQRYTYSNKGNFYRPSLEHRFDLFMDEEEWVLPEKWCIDMYDVNQSILEWINKNGKFPPYPASRFRGCFFIYPAPDLTHIYSVIPDGYTEITAEQFEKYILNKST